jgi:ribose-phosphate pyrophosphokinase
MNMTFSNRTPFQIFATESARELGKKVADALGQPLGQYHSETFSDGEKFVSFQESVRGHNVFLIGQINMPYENIFELFLATDAARRASANKVIAILPYLPHSRQERKGTMRTAIASRLIADLMQQSGIDRLITLDLHSGSIEGFFKIPVDHLFMSQIYIQRLKKDMPENLCLCSPDFGGLKRIKLYKEELQADMAVIHKERLRPNQVSHMEIIGDVSGKNVVIIDDMIDTAGTLCTAADLIMEKGAASVQAYATHAILSNKAQERIAQSELAKVWVSDSISYAKTGGKIEVVSCAKLLAAAIENLLSNKSFRRLGERDLV